MTDGLLLVDKPAGVTSHDVVDVVRRAVGTRRVGHAGTLDPFATGLLVLMVGRATRLLAYVDGEPKVYEAGVRFGAETDTDDLTGEVTRTAPPPTLDRVLGALPGLTGEIVQTPPAYSAKQVEGQRAHAAARSGAPLALEPVRVRVDAWEVRGFDGQLASVVVTCGGGTYIRALARDLGRLVDSAAHLASLRRVRSGPCDVGEAVPLDAVREGEFTLRSPLEALGRIAVVPLDEPDVTRVRRGMRVGAAAASPRAALVDAVGAVVAIAERDGDSWQPRVVLAGE